MHNLFVHLISVQNHPSPKNRVETLPGLMGFSGLFAASYVTLRPFLMAPFKNNAFAVLL
jgi:hypothetical protein